MHSSNKLNVIFLPRALLLRCLASLMENRLGKNIVSPFAIRIWMPAPGREMRLDFMFSGSVQHIKGGHIPDSNDPHRGTSTQLMMMCMRACAFYSDLRLRPSPCTCCSLLCSRWQFCDGYIFHMPCTMNTVVVYSQPVSTYSWVGGSNISCEISLTDISGLFRINLPRGLPG